VVIVSFLALISGGGKKSQNFGKYALETVQILSELATRKVKKTFRSTIISIYKLCVVLGIITDEGDDASSLRRHPPSAFNNKNEVDEARATTAAAMTLATRQYSRATQTNAAQAVPAVAGTRDSAATSRKPAVMGARGAPATKEMTMKERYFAKIEEDKLKVKDRMRQIAEYEDSARRARRQLPTRLAASPKTGSSSAVVTATASAAVGPDAPAAVAVAPAEADIAETVAEGKEEESLLTKQVKRYGRAGAASYILTELGFWLISIQAIVSSYHNNTGAWLSLSHEDDRSRIVALSAGFVTAARLAVRDVTSRITGLVYLSRLPSSLSVSVCLSPRNDTTLVTLKYNRCHLDWLWRYFWLHTSTSCLLRSNRLD